MTIKEELISILGKNSTHPCVFNENLEVDAIYTYKGNVYCLDKGMDFPIENVTNECQVDILDAIKSKKFIVDKTFQ
jgi:hypothetical protein